MDTAAKDKVPISTKVDGCARSFLSLAEILRKPTRFADQIESDAVLDEFDRFKLWAGNIAAHRKGRRSLDHRLRDADQLKAETNSLLASLEDALNTATAVVQGHRLPWDEEAFTDSDSESESSQDGSEYNLQGDTELKQLFARTKSLITSLMRLSMAIREPAPNRQARSIDKSHFEQHDMWHVQAKFPDAPQYLTERLGRAISSRRQYLTYREVHHDKLRKGIEKLGVEAATTEFTNNSTEATELHKTDSLAMTDDFDDSASVTSYATSVNATLRAPGLPKEAQEKDHYSCPLCFALIAIHTTAAWKRHVYQDLHPYCCTFEDCATADRLYDSRHTWFAHESEAHYATFQCVEGCSKTFRTEPEFETHIKSTHLDLAAPEIYTALRKVSAKAPSINEMRLCGLCGMQMTLRALQKHLGHHHEQLALFALPANLDDTEDEREGEDQGSLSRYKEQESGEVEEERDPSDSSGASEPGTTADDFSTTNGMHRFAGMVSDQEDDEVNKTAKKKPSTGRSRIRGWLEKASKLLNNEADTQRHADEQAYKYPMVPGEDFRNRNTQFYETSEQYTASRLRRTASSAASIRSLNEITSTWPGEEPKDERPSLKLEKVRELRLKRVASSASSIHSPAVHPSSPPATLTRPRTNTNPDAIMPIPRRDTLEDPKDAYRSFKFSDHQGWT